MRRGLATSGAVIVALVLPGSALAHLGKSAPVATNFQARIDGFTPATETVVAKIVDGDQALWLRATANATVLIPGAEGEPLLRFGGDGVFVNLRSPTAQLDGIDRFDLRPDPNPQANPLWHWLSSGHSYLWHDHRLHALEPLARGRRTASTLGAWSVPLRIDGRRHALEGVLLYRPPGSPWPWFLLACALATIPSGALVLSAPLARRVAVLAALVAMLLVWAVRIGRELYGRPTVGVGGEVEIALTSFVGIVLLYGLLHRDEDVRLFTRFLVAFGCLYQGLTMLPVLTHTLALTALPSLAARVSIAAILGLGAGLLAIILLEQFAESVDEDTAEANVARQREPRAVRGPGSA